MYTHFQTYNYHDDPISFLKEQQCLICWETSANYDEINQMQLLADFNKTCQCNSYFHNKCLFHWVIRNESCPICHKELTINSISNSNSNTNSFTRLHNFKLSVIQIISNKIVIIYVFNSIRTISQIITFYTLFYILFFGYISLHQEYTKQIQQTIQYDDVFGDYNAVYFYNYSCK